MPIFFSLVLLLVIIAALVNEYYAHKLKVVPMPTLPWVQTQILEALKAEVPSPAPLIYELGSGWGGLAYALARQFPEGRVIGYELSPVPFLISFFLRKRPNLKFSRKDVLTQSYHDADIVVFYLMPHLIERLKPLLMEQLPPGTLVVASGFPIKGWAPKHTIPLKKGLERSLYVYRV